MAMHINLLGCSTLDDVRYAVLAALDGETLVRGRRGARAHFRKAGARGCVRRDVVFQGRHEMQTMGPLHRDVFVRVLVFRYTAGGTDAVYDYSIVTY